MGIFLSSTGTLYFADQMIHRVRMINIITGIINTFTGTSNGFLGDTGPATSTKLSLPTGVWGNTAGIIFISDSGNNRIRQVSITNLITTYAGTGLTTFNGIK